MIRNPLQVRGAHWNWTRLWKRATEVCEIYEVWHFEWRGNSHSLDYVEICLCQKQEASGCPAWCVRADKEKLNMLNIIGRKKMFCSSSILSKTLQNTKLPNCFTFSMWYNCNELHCSNTTIARTRGVVVIPSPQLLMYPPAIYSQGYGHCPVEACQRTSDPEVQH